MNTKIKKQWAAALRSGKYAQTSSTLRKGNKFCCLGVLCNLHAQAHPELAATQKVKSKYLDEESYLPEEVRQWAGLDSRDGGTVKIGTNRTDLATHNDDGKSFRQIANAIVEQL